MKLLITISFCFICLFLNRISAQVNVQDSLALVDLYDSTNGANWNNHTNWLTPSPVSNWYGIITNNNRVTTLSLEGNNLTGFVPSSIGNISNLDTLDLFDNKIAGSIPASLGSLSNLETLDLGNNRIIGAIPASLSSLTNLKRFILYNNQLSGNIPPELGSLTNLTVFYLNSNQLSGNIPPELGNLKNVYTLDLEQNQLSGSIPSELKNLSTIDYLVLDNNQLSGNIPPELGSLATLFTLSLQQNKLTGNIPTEIGNLALLDFLQLDNNQLSGTIPAEIGNLTNLQYLSLFNNKLSGSIPLQFGNLTNLTDLYLNNNQLSESIPAEFGNLTNLQYLSFSHNQLTGNIPSGLGNFLGLKDLGLEFNQLTGNIPLQLGSLADLEYLGLNNNQLTGNIPSELGNLSKLGELDLNNNDLSGAIPLSLENLNLYSLSVQENQFTFNGMEQLVQKFDSDYVFKYAPQDTIALHYNGSVLSVSAGGTLANDTFHWYKNATLFKTITGDSTLTVTQKGIYNVTITNVIATQLTLYSDTLNITTLPVSLISFTAQKQNNTTLLHWQTANEINNFYFDVERSSNSKLFTSIGSKPALNNTSKNNYAFVDNAPLRGINYYRLKQVDKDGKFTYSNIVSVDFESKAAVFAVYPNPANNSLNITLPSTNNTSQIILYDVNGRKVLHEQLASNINTKQLDISNLSAGVYNIVLMQDDKQQTIKVVKK